MVTGTIVITDPEGDALEVSTTSAPADGIVQLDPTAETGVYTYTFTPSDAARVVAGLAGGPGLAGFELTVTDNNTAPVVTTVDTPVTPASLAKASTIDLGSAPVDMTVSQDGTKVYALLADKSVTVVDVTDPDNPTVQNHTLTGANLGNDTLTSVAVSPNGDTLYIGTNTAGRLYTVNTSSWSTTRKTASSTQANTSVLAVSADGGTLYVAGASNRLGTLDTTTFAYQTISAVNFGYTPTDLKVSADGDTLYAVNYNTGAVTAVDMSTNTIITTFTEGNGVSGVATSADGTLVYTTNTNGTVTVFDNRVTGPPQELTTATGGTDLRAVVVGADGTVYAASNSSSSISVLTISPHAAPTVEITDVTVDTVIGVVTATVVADDPDNDALTYSVSDTADGSVTFDEATNTLTYTPTSAARLRSGLSTDWLTDTVSITVADGVDGSTIATANVLIVGAELDTTATFTDGLGAPVAVATATNTVYVANANNTVSVIDTSTPGSPTTAATITGLSSAPTALALSVDGTTLYVGGAELAAYDVSDTGNPTQLGSAVPLGTPTSSIDDIMLSADGTTLFAAKGGSIYAVNTTTPATLSAIGNRDFVGYVPSEPLELALSSDGSTLFVGNGNNVYAYNVANPANITRYNGSAVNSVAGSVVDLAVDGTTLYIATDTTLITADVSTPQSPATLDTLTLPGSSFSALTLSPDNTVAYLTDTTTDTVSIVDITDPTALTHLTDAATAADPSAITVGDDGTVYVTSETANALSAMTITSLNSVPVANDDAVTIDENGIVTIDVLSNDTDLDAVDTLSVASFDQPAHGIVILNGNGTLTYIANAHYNGTDTFAYTVTDGVDTSNEATVTVTINAVNDAPNAVNDTITIYQDTSVTLDLLNNDTDIDGDPVTISAIDTTTAAGGTVDTAVDLGTGAVTYTYSAPAGFSGTDTFSYTVSDPSGATDTATVTVTVIANNNATATTSVDSVDPGTGVVTGTIVVTDPDGDTQQVTGTVDPDVGSVTIESSATPGEYTYTFTPSEALRLTTGLSGQPTTADFTVTLDDGATRPAELTVTAPVTGGTLGTIGDFSTSAYASDMAVSPDGSTLYVIRSQSDTVAVIDITDPGAPVTVKTLSVNIGSQSLTSVAASPDGSKVFVTTSSHAVFAIDVASGTSAILSGLNADTVAVSADGTTLYLATITGGHLATAHTDGSNYQVLTSVNFGYTPEELKVSADGTKLYAADYTTGKVSVVDLATSTVATFTTGAKVVGVAASADGTLIYVADEGASVVAPGTVRVYDYRNPASPTALATIEVGDEALGLAVGADGTVYVSTHTPSSVVMLTISQHVAPTVQVSDVSVDTATGVVTATLVVEDPDNAILNYSVSDPSYGSVSFDESTGTLTYVPTSAAQLAAGLGGQALGDTLTFVVDDTADGTATAIIAVPVVPADLTTSATFTDGLSAPVAVATGATTVYLANGTSVSVIDTSDSSNPATLATITFTSAPTALALSADGATLYVGSTELTAYDVSSPGLPTQLGSPVTMGGGSINDLVLSADGSTLFASQGSTIYAMTTTNLTVQGSQNINGTNPITLALSSDADTLYAGRDGRVYAYDVSNPTNLSRYTNTIGSLSGSVVDLALSADDNTLYIATTSTLVTANVTNPASPAKLGTLTLPGSTFSAIALSPDQSVAYLSDAANDTISVIDITYRTAATHLTDISTAAGPSAITISDAAVLYVAGETANSLSVLTMSSDASAPTMTAIITTDGTYAADGAVSVVVTATAAPAAGAPTLSVTAPGDGTVSLNGTPAYDTATGTYTATYQFVPSDAERLIAGAAGADGVETFALTADYDGTQSGRLAIQAPVGPLAFTPDTTVDVAAADLTTLAMSPNGQYLYVVDTEGKSLTVLDTATGLVIAKPLGVSPTAVAVNPTTGKVYVAAVSEDSVTVFNVSGSVSTTWTVSAPTALAVSADGATLYVTTYDENADGSPTGQLIAIDTQTGAMTQISSGAASFAVVTSPTNAAKAYSLNLTTGQISAVTAGTGFGGAVTYNTTTLSTGLTSGYDLSISPDGTTLYAVGVAGGGLAGVSAGQDVVVAVDRSTGALIAIAVDAAESVTTSADGSVLYVVSSGSGARTVTALDAATMTVVTSATVADDTSLLYGAAADTALAGSATSVSTSVRAVALAAPNEARWIVNQAPDPVDDTFFTGPIGTIFITADQLLANDIDSDGDPLTVTAVSQPTFGTLDGNLETGILVYNAPNGFDGTDTFTYTVSDGATTSTGTVTVVVGTPSVSVTGDGETGADGAATWTVTATGTGGSEITSVIVDDEGSHGTAEYADGVLTFTADPAYTHGLAEGIGSGETAGLTLTVTDANGATTTQFVNFLLTPTNSGPELVSVSDVSFGGGGIHQYTVATADADGDAVQVAFDPAHNLRNGDLSYDAETGEWTYDASAFVSELHLGEQVTETFSIVLTDGYGGFTVVNQDVTLNGQQNSAPHVDQNSTTPTYSFQTGMDDHIAYDLNYIIDDENDPLTYTLLSQPTYGHAGLNEDTGTWVYTDSGSAGTPPSQVKFTIRVSDGYNYDGSLSYIDYIVKLNLIA